MPPNYYHPATINGGWLCCDDWKSRSSSASARYDTKFIVHAAERNQYTWPQLWWIRFATLCWPLHIEVLTRIFLVAGSPSRQEVLTFHHQNYKRQPETLVTVLSNNSNILLGLDSPYHSESPPIRLPPEPHHYLWICRQCAAGTSMDSEATNHRRKWATIAPYRQDKPYKVTNLT